MRTESRDRSRLVFFVLVLAATLIITVYHRGSVVIDGGERVVLTVLTPIHRGFSYVARPVSRAYGHWAGLSAAKIENDRLVEENRALRARLRDLSGLEDENRRLLSLAGFRDTGGFLTLGVRVIGRSPSNWESGLVIDSGMRDGLETDMVVVTEDGLVGRLATVSNFSAVVQLITDRSSGVAVEVKRNGHPGVVRGGIGGALRLRYLNREADVRVGDKLVTSGAGGVFPRGVLVGEVADTESSRYSQEKLVTVEASADLDQLEELLVVTGEGGVAVPVSGEAAPE